MTFNSARESFALNAGSGRRFASPHSDDPRPPGKCYAPGIGPGMVMRVACENPDRLVIAMRPFARWLAPRLDKPGYKACRCSYRRAKGSRGEASAPGGCRPAPPHDIQTSCPMRYPPPPRTVTDDASPTVRPGAASPTGCGPGNTWRHAWPCNGPSIQTVTRSVTN